MNGWSGFAGCLGITLVSYQIWALLDLVNLALDCVIVVSIALALQREVVGVRLTLRCEVVGVQRETDLPV